MPTKIEWTQSDDGVAGETWNVVRGCSRVSPGCGGARGEGGCYAERQAIRQAGPGGAYEGLVRVGKQGPRWTGKVVLVPEKLTVPLDWKKARRIFVNSMSDLFHERLTNEEIAAIFGVMASCPQHTFQILTKRAKRMREWFEWVAAEAHATGRSEAQVCVDIARGQFSVGSYQMRIGEGADWPLPNVWMGVSVETQEYANERIPELLRVPAAIRFVSYEPALGPVTFSKFFKTVARASIVNTDVPGQAAIVDAGATELDPQPGLDWLIVGGESGPGSRSFEIEWARSVVRECAVAGVACFVKQLGRRPVSGFDGEAFNLPLMRKMREANGADCSDVHERRPLPLISRKGNDMDEWPADLRVRQWPKRGAHAAVAAAP